MQVPSDRLDIERVIKQTFHVAGRNLFPFGLMALLLVSLPNFMLVWSQAQMDDPDPRALLSRIYPLSLIEIAFAAILQACIIHGSIMDLKGRRSTFGEILSEGAHRAIPAFIISFLMVIGITLSLALLLIPISIIATVTGNLSYMWLCMLAVPIVLMLFCAWAVAVPAGITEDIGVFGALRRSRELTRGSRWRVVGTFLLFALIMIALYLAIQLGVVISTLGASDLDGLHAPAAIVGNAVLSGVSGLLGAVMIAVLYEELRRIRASGDRSSFETTWSRPNRSRGEPTFR